MPTFEEVTQWFLRSTRASGLTAHPETWVNAQTMEREFTCALHRGSCEEAESHATCAITMGWGVMDTALSYEGVDGVCDFFHDPDESCPHTHAEEIPPLTIDLAYSINFSGVLMGEIDLQMVTRSLKLRASEHCSRATETQAGVAVVQADNGLQVEGLTLRQRVEIPLWHPDKVTSRLGDDEESGEPNMDDMETALFSNLEHDDDEEDSSDNAGKWLPVVLKEVCADICRVLDDIDEIQAMGRIEGPQQN